MNIEQIEKIVQQDLEVKTQTYQSIKKNKIDLITWFTSSYIGNNIIQITKYLFYSFYISSYIGNISHNSVVFMALFPKYNLINSCVFSLSNDFIILLYNDLISSLFLDSVYLIHIRWFSTK